MTKVQTLFCVLAVSFMSLAGCGTDAKYSCTCAAMCDGAAATDSQTVCASQDELESAVDDSVDMCEAELAESCADYSCSCTCTPTGDDC